MRISFLYKKKKKKNVWNLNILTVGDKKISVPTKVTKNRCAQKAIYIRGVLSIKGYNSSIIIIMLAEKCII